MRHLIRVYTVSFIQQILDELTGSEMYFLEAWKELELSDYLLRVQYSPKHWTDRPEQNVASDQRNYTPLGTAPEINSLHKNDNMKQENCKKEHTIMNLES